MAFWATACGANDGDIWSDEPFGQVTQEIQRDVVNIADTSNTRLANVVRNSGDFGNVFGVMVTGNGDIDWSCGMTFISEHMAVTAAHCVKDHPVGALVPAARVTTTSLQATAVNARGTVSGEWSDWSSGPLMTSSQGYAQEGYWCWVLYRCSDPKPPAGSDICPEEAEQVLLGLDIAMLSCQRPEPKYWVPVHNNGDPTSGSVEAFWFHEVLRLARWPEDSNNDDPADNWENYGKWDSSNLDQNYHYTDARWHQYLYIRSSTWDSGNGSQEYKITNSGSVATATDIPTCHGASGSGIFMANSTALLGPLFSGGGDSSFTSLCERSDQVSPGDDYSVYYNPSITIELEKLDVVKNDR